MNQRPSPSISLVWGALADPISWQLDALGLRVRDYADYEKDANAITRLNVRGLLSDSAAMLARQKLMRKIVKHVEVKRDVEVKPDKITATQLLNYYDEHGCLPESEFILQKKDGEHKGD